MTDFERACKTMRDEEKMKKVTLNKKLKDDLIQIGLTRGLSKRVIANRLAKIENMYENIHFSNPILSLLKNRRQNEVKRIG